MVLHPVCVIERNGSKIKLALSSLQVQCVRYEYADEYRFN
ncbi:hypothetical protein ES703_04172 [subsurface metagenome]